MVDLTIKYEFSDSGVATLMVNVITDDEPTGEQSKWARVTARKATGEAFEQIATEQAIANAPDFVPEDIVPPTPPTA